MNLISDFTPKTIGLLQIYMYMAAISPRHFTGISSTDSLVSQFMSASK